MKKNHCLLVLLIAVTVSCNKNIELNDDISWKDSNAKEFVDNIYASLGNGGFEEQMLSSISDETLFTYPGTGINTVNEGNATPSNTGWISPNCEWGNMYKNIYACNTALDKLGPANIVDAMKNQLKGEAYFLRAYFNQQLLRFYGGFIITKSASTDINLLARSSFEDCVNFIVSDCDSADNLLKTVPIIPGHATSLAALALKSRVLLYTASDLHDLSIASTKSPLIASFTNVFLICNTTGNRIARLQAAQQAAYAVLNYGYGGYMLTLSAPVSTSDAIFNSLVISSGGKFLITSTLSQELIFAKYFSTEKDQIGNHVGLYNGPNGYHNKANNTPTGLLADDYEMMDGSKFSWSNPSNKSNPFVNRDPRFYASILYDGAAWKPRDLVGVNSDPGNGIQTGQYQTGTGMIAGLDTRQSTIDGQNGSWTGYYMRKFIDPSFSIIDETDRQFYPWPFIRMTEIVFNYAEASFELGQEDVAKAWINKVRFRAGMPAITSSGSALRDRYRNERRIEFAFEEQRYHDARRWMIAPATLGRSLTYVKVTANLKPGSMASNPYRYDQSKYNYTYTPVVDNSQENRIWNDKMYYLPISASELAKNKNLIQNPGY